MLWRGPAGGAADNERYPPNTALNTPYAFTFTAQGGNSCSGPVNYSWTAVGLPPGLVLNQATGVLAGSATTAGPYNPTITLNDDCDPAVNQNYTINVAPNKETFYVLNPNRQTSTLSITAVNGGATINCPGTQMTDPCFSYFNQEPTPSDLTTDGQGNFIVPIGSEVLKFTPGSQNPVVVAQNTNPGLSDASQVPSLFSAVADSAGNIIVADNLNQAIWLFPAAGGDAILVGNYPPDGGGEDVFVRIPPGAPGQYVVVEDEAGANTSTQFYTFTACTPATAQCPQNNNPVALLAQPIQALVNGLTFDALGNYVTSLSGANGPYVAITNATTGVVQTLFNNRNILPGPVGIFYDSQTGNYLVANQNLDPSGLYSLSSGPVNGAGAALIFAGANLADPLSVVTLPPPPQNVVGSPVIAPLVISGGPLPGGFAFESYSSGVTASGGIPPYTYSGTGFPAGINVNPFTGAITGTTRTTGSFPLAISVTDSRGASTAISLTLTITAPPPVSVSGGVLPATPVQIPVSLTLSASGGAPPYTWTLAAGSLPPGLALHTSGTVTGTPLVTGPYFFTARATDTSGGTAVGTFSITIQPPALVPTTSSPLPSGMVNVNYPEFSFSLNGGVLPYLYNVTGGTFPPGLTLNPYGLITGIPTTAGNYTFTVNQADASTDPSITYAMTIQPFTPDLILSAGSAAFTLSTPTSTLPPAQTVQVQSSEVTQTLGYSVSISPASATWLSVTATGSTTPGAFAIALTNAALALSPANTPYTATVVATCSTGSCTGTQHTVNVTLTVDTAPAQLSVLTPQLTFNTLNYAPQITTELLPVSNTGGGAIGFASITCGAPWCTVSGVPGSLGAGLTAALSVTANPAGLSAGYYYTDLSIVSSAGNAQVPVTLLIAPNGTIALYPSGVEFNLPQGGQAQGLTSFEVSISGTQAIPFTAAVSPAVPWLTVTQSQPDRFRHAARHRESRLQSVSGFRSHGRPLLRDRGAEVVDRGQLAAVVRGGSECDAADATNHAESCAGRSPVFDSGRRCHSASADGEHLHGFSDHRQLSGFRGHSQRRQLAKRQSDRRDHLGRVGRPGDHHRQSVRSQSRRLYRNGQLSVLSHRGPLRQRDAGGVERGFHPRRNFGAASQCSFRLYRDPDCPHFNGSGEQLRRARGMADRARGQSFRRLRFSHQ